MKENKILINKVEIILSTIYFNKAISFMPCFKYKDGEDVIIFTSENFYYLVD
jgi:hypothetical protein